jgi:hypothetical protein
LYLPKREYQQDDPVWGAILRRFQRERSNLAIVLTALTIVVAIPFGSKSHAESAAELARELRLEHLQSIESVKKIIYESDWYRLALVAEGNVEPTSGDILELAFSDPDQRKSQDVTIFEANEAEVISDANGRILISSGFLRQTIRSAFDVEFGSLDDLMKGLSSARSLQGIQFQDALEQLGNALKPNSSDQRSYPSLSRLAHRMFHQEETIFERVEMPRRTVRDVLMFAIAHERGHFTLGHHKIKISSCDQLQEMEFAADKFAVLTSLNGIPGGLTAQTILLGAPAVDMFQSYREIGFSGVEQLSGCSYPSREERFARVAPLIKVSFEQAQAALKQLYEAWGVKQQAE